MIGIIEMVVETLPSCVIQARPRAVASLVVRACACVPMCVRARARVRVFVCVHARARSRARVCGCI
jgi:hypothetical protein